MRNSTTDLLSECRSLIEQQKFAAALNLLQNGNFAPSNPEHQAALGLAYFHQEQYGLAATAYEEAVRLDDSCPEWQEMLQLSKDNELSEVNIPVPEVYHFEREKLLRTPLIEAGVLPSPPSPTPPAGLVRRISTSIGNGLGELFTRIMEFLAQSWGKIAGYRDQIWTNWYRRPMLLAILTLAYMRERLNRNNLKSTYPGGALIGFQAEGQTPPEGVTHFRTADGSWNNLEDPLEGAAGTRFPRNVNNEAVRPETGEALMTPNPREVSLKLLTRDEKMKEVPFLNLLAASWIQFENHDWINHGENALNDLLEIPLPENDPARKKFWQTKMLVPKTQPDPTRLADGEEIPVTFINEVTHWWDGSQIYGSDQATVDRLRSGVDGKLRINADGTLPLDSKKIEETGFVRNWWVGLAMLHNLFAREHNAICDHLKVAYPEWDDNRLFNVARLINAAVMAKIHSVEWTPAILANKTLDNALNANWYGLLTNLFRKGSHRKTVAGINVRNPELGGVVGNPIDKHGSPFGLTEEFVEVYRLHSLLPERLHIRRIKKDGIEEVPFIKTRQAGSAKLTGKVGMADLFYSFGNQHPGQLVLNNYPSFMQELSIPFNPTFDLGAIDILRARERGVPRYNEFRRQLGLNPISRFEDLTDDAEQVQKLKEVYGERPEDVEKLDLMIGTLAEGHRPYGFGFGETMFQIFILNATRRLQADRFYTTCYTEEYYTKEGLEWIDKTDLKTVLLRHYPELAETGLANVKNAFEPWDTDPQLDPARHPLRGWDKSLKKDPWTGDAYREGRSFDPARESSSITAHTVWQQDIRYLGGSREKEERLIREFAEDIREVVRASAKEHKGGPVRPQHAKQLAGIKRAEFRVASKISADLQFGFLQPGKVYPAYVRFSNAGGVIRTSDSEKDLRGVAIRVIADRGQAHDWLMTNAEEHHAENAIEAMATTLAFSEESFLTDYLEELFGEDADLPDLMRKLTDIADKVSGIRRLLVRVGPKTAIHILRTLNRQMKQPVPSLATETFWSRAPIAIGEVAAKYLLRPQQLAEEGPTPENLHAELAQRLRRGSVSYDFCLQRYQDHHTTPIEDARLAWSSPHEKIGELVLLQQDLDDETGQRDSAMIDALAFNPWQVNTPDFVPIGNMNRARKLVYRASAEER